MIEEKTFFTLTAGVYILGCRQNNKNYGCIIDTVMQVSFTPPKICISCEKKAYSQKIIRETGRFSISVLPQDISQNVIKTFGYHSSKDTDKWETVPFELQNDLPIYLNSISILTAHVTLIQELETHFVFIAEIDEARQIQKKPPLTYAYYRKHMLETVCSSNTTSSQKWICQVCGYIYNEKTPFEELEDNYRCPICGVQKEYFKLQSH